MSDLIANYAASLRQNLAFDRRSAERLADEAQDHLHEALVHDESCQSDEAVRRAIRRFGSPAEIAAAYTAQMFPQQLRLTWRSSILLGGLVVLTMWLRRTLDLLPPLNEFSGFGTLLSVDTIGFRIAIAVGVFAWLLSLNDTEGRRASSIVHLLVAASAALCLSVAASLVIASMGVVVIGWSSSALIPMGSTLLACGLMTLLVLRIRVLRGYASLVSQNRSATE